MGITQTPRLQLQKQSADDPDWNVALDAGFDNADARLLKISSGNGNQADPNGPPIIAGDYVGQLYLDETLNPPRHWRCTTAGASAVWRLINTNSVLAPGAGHGGNTVLEAILADYQARLLALETTPVPPRGMIDGLTMSWEAAGAELGVAPGECADSTNSFGLVRSAAWTKTLTSWVAGDGNGGVSPTQWAADGNSILVGQWYHTFLVWKASTSHGIAFDRSFSGANLVTDGFTYIRRIGSWLAAAGPIVTRFNQYNDFFEWYQTVQDYDAGLTTSPVTVTLTVPPGLSVMAALMGHVLDEEADAGFYIYSDQKQDEMANRLAGRISCSAPAANYYAAAGCLLVPTTTAQQVRLVGSRTITTVDIATFGWFDPRGKDA